MAWRHQGSHTAENAAVGKALRAAGINAQVGHGRGTAWGWLHINIGAGQQWGEHAEPGLGWCSAKCRRCQNLKAMRRQAYTIALEASGRGDTKEINVYSQDRWDRKLGRSVPISHPDWRDVTAQDPDPPEQPPEPKPQSPTTSPEPEPSAQGTDHASVAVARNHQRNGIEITFTSKPPVATRTALKTHSFRWSRRQSLWWARYTPERYRFAQSLANSNGASVPATANPADAPPSGSVPDPRIARFRELADKMETAIESKRHPAIADQRPTQRRMRIASGMLQDAQRLEKVQAGLRALADAIETGTLPQTLGAVAYKGQVEDLITWSSYGRYCSKATRYIRNYAQARADLLALIEAANPVNVEARAEAERLRRIREIENEALLTGKSTEYFPTPPSVAAHMVELADLRHGMRVLEPSAGCGAIADKIAEVPGVTLQCVEISARLVECLKLKGHDVEQVDFLDYSPGEQFACIIMNPPFGQDVEHVRHAYELLAPAGRLVAIMAEGVFFRTDKKRSEFREWAAERTDHTEKLPAGTFTTTGVASRIIVLRKPPALTGHMMRHEAVAQFPDLAQASFGF